MENKYVFTELDQYLFGHATHNNLYEKLGAHPTEISGQRGTYFAVWAPNARSVSVIGDFNGWNPDANRIADRNEIGVWQTFIPGVMPGQLYKFYIDGANGQKLFKADPFANQSEFRPGTASVVADLSGLKWTDGAWMKDRASFDIEKSPMVIYECHIGSWKKPADSDDTSSGFTNYREFAEECSEYLKDMGYTHVELMGIAEHPFDGSWGYQVTGYYAPTSRYGTPEDFAYMINCFHKSGIGVILDWVPAHFPKDESGLANFDGEALYEHADPRQGEHPEWGTKIFNYGRPEVKNFLLANALFWIEEMHVDGLRVDAVASMLYLDYGKRDGQWVANKYGENKNLEAIEFFKHLNSMLRGRNPGILMIAEESTAWPKVTGDVEKDGLGFSMKWNMGWMNDFLEYMKLDPLFRKGNHYKMTFSTSYAYSEKYVLVLSHDEVVHLKGSMWNKMPGIYEDKFSNLKAGYTYMTAHPGKKLLFMGQDFGQAREWSEEREIDWFLLEKPLNRQLHDYVRELWKLYKKYPALYATDYDYRGFEWINADDADRSIYSFVRKDPTNKTKNLLFVLNMTPMPRDDYRVGCFEAGRYKLILNSMDPKFGGNVTMTKKTYTAKEGECDGKPYSFGFKLPPYGAMVFEYEHYVKPAAKKAASKKTAGKAASDKAAEKKTAGKTAVKKTPAKKVTAEKPAEKKAAAKKAPAEKPVEKKTAAKKVTAEKPVEKKTAAKKVTAEKPVEKKTTAKKAPAEKPVRKTTRRTASKKTGEEKE
jgi:1,4-alpha-glucan branching enzyme